MMASVTWRGVHHTNSAIVPSLAYLFVNCYPSPSRPVYNQNPDLASSTSLR